MSLGKKLIAFVLTLPAWVLGGAAIYEAARQLSCARLLDRSTSLYGIWCVYIDWDFRPDSVLVSLLSAAGALVAAVLPERPHATLRKYLGISWLVAVGLFLLGTAGLYLLGE